jgi:cytochrome c oxidase subunit 3
LSEAHSGVVAHQFDDAQQQQETTSLGMWSFLITEVMMFGALFTGYAYYKTLFPAAFIEGSHHLDYRIGAINTAVLICSSLTMALGVHAAQTSRRNATILFLVLTILLGSVFLGVKVVEYSDKFEHHLVPGRNFSVDPDDETVNPRNVELFFCFYFIMTGLHAAHMIIGIAIIGILVILAWQNRFSSEYHAPVEMTGLYWHFVDIVWIFLFPFLYLLGRG